MLENKVYFGEVVWFNNIKGYGFISWKKDGEKQKDMFCHYTDIACKGYKTLKKEQKVSFEIGMNKNNVVKAVNINLL